MIEIDIVIKMGEDCEKRMSMQEARELSLGLNQLFMSGNGTAFPITHRIEGIPPEAQGTQAGSETGMQRAERLKAEASRKTGGCGCGKKKESSLQPGSPTPRTEKKTATRGRPAKKPTEETKNKG